MKARSRLDELVEQITECTSTNSDDPHAFAVKIESGDHMGPNMQIGDFVVFEPGKAVNDGDIALVKERRGTMHLRRCYHEKTKLRLKTDKPNLPDIFVEETEIVFAYRAFEVIRQTML